MQKSSSTLICWSFVPIITNLHLFQNNSSAYKWCKYAKATKMNRPRKFCCYRDCTTNSYANPERTLFQFPKDEARANKWLKAGAIDKVDLPRFMCDLHFSRIYMCFSARRKMLLNTAVPYVYGSCDEEQDQELVQSTSQEFRDEESLSDDVIEHEMPTEIIYVNNEGEMEESEQIEEEPSVALKRPVSLSPEAQPKTKIIKIEKLPNVTPSTVVSSSSTNTTNDPLKTTVVSDGLILRKVKLRKISKTGEKQSERMVLVNTAVKNEEENVTMKPVEQKASLSLSPAKKNLNVSTENAQSCTKIAQTPQTVSSPASSSNPKRQQSEPSVTSAGTKEKHEQVYEFIFKGEEYIQLPKSQYIAEKQELEDLVDQSQQEKCELQKQLNYYKTIVNKLKQTLQDIPE